jgi:predicted dehydrogenase
LVNFIFLLIGKIFIDNARIELTSGCETRSISFRPTNGVQEELAVFIAAMRKGVPHRNTPEEALRDVAIISALLRSAESGRAVQVDRV